MQSIPKSHHFLMTLEQRKSAVILLVEDDLGDQVLIREALEEIASPENIFVARDGEEALQFLSPALRRAGEAAPLPSLIVLDLNMPGIGGREVLAEVKSDVVLKTIPVVVFTTSCRPADVILCYEAGANSFVQKPSDFEKFQSVLRQLGKFWIQISTPLMYASASTRPEPDGKRQSSHRANSLIRDDDEQAWARGSLH